MAVYGREQNFVCLSRFVAFAYSIAAPLALWDNKARTHDGSSINWFWAGDDGVDDDEDENENVDDDDDDDMDMDMDIFDNQIVVLI